MKLQCGREVVKVDKDTECILKDHFEGFERFGVYQIVPGKFYVSEEFLKNADEMYNFQVDPSDVFVTSYLKTGSTWLQEVVWAILHNADLNHPDGDKDSYSKCPWFETACMLKPEDMPRVMVEHIPKDMTLYQAYAFLEKPRVFKTHSLFDCMNPDTIKKAKVVYVIRDPRDTCISYYHFTRSVRLYGYRKPLETFVEDFIRGTLFCGSYLDHLKQWWKVKDNPNIYTIYYEDLRKNSAEELKKLGNFLGVDLSDQQVKNVSHYTSFDEMKKRDIMEKSAEARAQFLKEDGTGFFRKGTSGTAKEDMTPEQRERIAKYFRDNLGEIKLPYDFS